MLYGGIMRTTLDLPEKLINEAMAVAHVKTKTGVITIALEQLIRKRNIAKLKSYKGKVDLQVDLDFIRERG